MHNLAQARGEARDEIFQATALARAMRPELVEKDFWVCWVLERLWTLPQIAPQLLFKGGTSLSKCFNLIERFSEDIDVGIAHEILGFDGTREPTAQPSKGKQKDAVKELSRTVTPRWITETLQPALREHCAQILGESCSLEQWRSDGNAWCLEVRDEKDGTKSLQFHPPSGIGQAHEYILRSVKIEPGALTVQEPFEMRCASSYAAQQFPEYFSLRDTPQLRVLSPAHILGKSDFAACIVSSASRQAITTAHFAPLLRCGAPQSIGLGRNA